MDSFDEFIDYELLEPSTLGELPLPLIIRGITKFEALALSALQEFPGRLPATIKDKIDEYTSLRADYGEHLDMDMATVLYTTLVIFRCHLVIAWHERLIELAPIDLAITNLRNPMIHPDMM